MSLREPARPCWSPPLGRCARDVFTYMVTPDRIPQFIIPSLAVHKDSRPPSQGKEPPEQKAPRRSSSEPAVKNKRALQGAGPCCSGAELASWVEEIPDPVTRAALSLPHLPKITTPYGFLSLGQSPRVTNEEALFSHLHGACSRCPGARKQLATQEQLGQCRHPGAPSAHTDSRSGMGGCLRDCRQPPRRKGSKRSPGCKQPARGSQVTGVRQGREAEDSEGNPKPLPVESDRSSFSAPGQPAKKHGRNFFQSLLKKHFAHFRHFPLH